MPVSVWLYKTVYGPSFCIMSQIISASFWINGEQKKNLAKWILDFRSFYGETKDALRVTAGNRWRELRQFVFISYFIIFSV